MLCPVRKNADGGPAEPSELELITIRFDEDKQIAIRHRLSDIYWWMRLLPQRIAQRANKEDETEGKVWQNRYLAVRFIDEEAILACAAYVGLNPIRAGIAQTIQDSQFTSASARLQAIVGAEVGTVTGTFKVDGDTHIFHTNATTVQDRMACAHTAYECVLPSAARCGRKGYSANRPVRHFRSRCNARPKINEWRQPQSNVQPRLLTSRPLSKCAWLSGLSPVAAAQWLSKVGLLRLY